MEQPKLPEIKNEKNEYSFETAILAIVERIEKIHAEKDLIVVSVAGPSSDDINVGKSTVTGKIEWTCRERNIPVVSINSENSIDKETKGQLEAERRNCRSKKGVIILGAMASPSDITDKEKIEMFMMYKDKSVKFVANACGLDISGIDIRVFVYRPDRKLPTEADRAIADFIIRNDKAVDVNPRIKI
jgi:hypothetical protein